jgi:hypothetical protein
MDILTPYSHQSKENMVIFYVLPVRMERECPWSSHGDQETLYAVPMAGAVRHLLMFK